MSKYELITKYPLLAPRYFDTADWIKPQGELVQKYQLYYDGEPWGDPIDNGDALLRLLPPGIRGIMIKKGFRVRLRWFIV